MPGAPDNPETELRRLSTRLDRERKIPHSIGFSGRQIASDGEGSSTLDFPLIHDARLQDQS